MKGRTYHGGLDEALQAIADAIEYRFETVSYDGDGMLLIMDGPSSLAFTLTAAELPLETEE